MKKQQQPKAIHKIVQKGVFNMALHCISGGECTGCMACRDETKVMYRCDLCGEEIYEGYMYYEAGEEIYCEDCVKYKEA